MAESRVKLDVRVALLGCADLRKVSPAGSIARAAQLQPRTPAGAVVPGCRPAAQLEPSCLQAPLQCESLTAKAGAGAGTFAPRCREVASLLE